MDNFIDKLAQKFNAQEMIKANSQAEARELEKLQQQVAEYERILQEIRKLNYKTSELSDHLYTGIGDNAEKISALREEEQRIVSSLRDITDEQTRGREAELEMREQERLEKEQDAQEEFEKLSGFLDERLQSIEDFVHKENVKVYRNVQAVVVDEVKKSTEAVSAQVEAAGKKTHQKINAVLAISIISMLAALAGVALNVLMLLGII